MEFIVSPLLWWLALVPLLLGVYAWTQTRRARDAVPISQLSLLKEALAGRQPTAGRRHAPPVLVVLGLAIAALALARPAVRTPLPKDSATIILVLDVSGSMGASDMFPSRLSAAKRASKGFVGNLPAGFRIGVVAFSSTAALVQPVTEDHNAVRAAIDELDLGGGTAIGDGLDVALAALPRPTPPAATLVPALPAGPPPPPPGVVLLLTDGANTEGTPPIDVAQKARAANVPVFTVGMGSRGGGLGRGGGIDEPLLREIAAQTGG